MRKVIPSGLRATVAAVLIGISTVVHVPPLLVIAIFKALAPFGFIRRPSSRVLVFIAESWNAFNTFLIRVLTHTRITVQGNVLLRREGRYLVLANHQSWVDIPVLEGVLNRKAPMLRFFLKSQLFWVPLLGLAWWALDFPFMKRYSRETLARRPELAGRDIEATRRACEKFQGIPVSLINFVEGTRFTRVKHAAQSSPFQHLLRPKAGGVAFVMGAMGGALQSILDITLVYPAGKPTIADLFGDRIPEVRVHLLERAIPGDLVGGDYQNDTAYRERVQAWINTLWQEKDGRIATLLSTPLDPSGR